MTLNFCLIGLLGQISSAFIPRFVTRWISPYFELENFWISELFTVNLGTEPHKGVLIT